MPQPLSSDDLQRLRGLVPLHTLPEDELERLVEYVSVASVKPKEVLFNQGDTDHDNVYLLSGRVALLSKGSVVERVESGTETARFPLAHQLPRKYMARAETKSRVARVDSRRLSDFLARSHTEDYQVADVSDASEDDWMSLLLQSRVLQQVPASNIQRVMMSVEQVEVAKGTDLISQGDPGDYYYVLTRGRAVVRRDSGDGKGPVELATLGPGDAFGEEALLSDNPRNSTVTLLQNGHVLRLSKENFLQLIHDPLLVRLDSEGAQRRIDEGAIWLDLRSGEAYDESHREGAINLPFESLRYQTSSLAPEHHYVIYSDTTPRAVAGAFLLTERGFDVSVLEQPKGDAGSAESPPVGPVVDVAATATASASADVDSEIRQRAQEAEQRAQQLAEQLADVRRDREVAEAERVEHMAQVRDAVDLAKRKLRETEEQKREALEAQQQAYSDMERLTSNLEALQSERTSLVERMSEIEGLDKQLQARLAKAERELIGERERAESAAHSLGELTQRLNDEMERREQEQVRYAQERGELKEELTALHLELEQANLDLEELRDRLAEQATARGADAESIAANEQVLVSLRDEHAAIVAERDMLREKNDALQQQIDDASGRMAQAANDAEGERAALAEQLSALQVELEGLRAQQARAASEGEQQSQAADAELQQLRGQLDDLAKQRDDLQQALDEAGRQQAQADERHAEAERRERELAEANEAAQQKLQQALDEAGRQQAQADERHAEAGRREHELAEANEAAQQRLQQAEAEASAARDEIAALQKASAEAESAAAAELDTLRQSLEALREQHAALQKELAADNSEASAAMAQAHERVAELEAQLAAREEESARLQEAQRAELDETRQALTDRSGALAAAQASAAELAADLAQAQESRSTAEARIAELEQAAVQQQQDAERQSGEHLAERDGLQQQLDTLSAELEAARGQQAAAEARIAELDARAADSQQLNEQLSTEQAQALAARDAEVAELQSRLEQETARLTALQDEQDALHGHAETERAGLEAELQEARRSLEAAEQKAQQLDAALVEAQADNEQQQQALLQQREAQEQAAATLAVNDDRQRALEADLQQLRDENARLVEALEEAAKTEQASATAREELAELAQRLEERELALKAARNEQAELIEALNAASAERETLQLSLSDQDGDQARLVDLENQLATLQHEQQSELLRHERQQQLLEEQLEQANGLRSALEEEVGRLTELIEDDANTDDGDVRAERDALQAELALRESEVEQLRGVLEEYVDQIRAAQTGGGDASETEALRAELEMVREQAVRDVAHMREQLAAAERQQRRLQEADGREAVSHESMRQRIEELEGAIAERQRDLARAESARHMLEDELEDANTTVDTLRREAEQLREDADQAMLARREAENAREQLQKALEEHHAHVSEARDQDLRDDRLHTSNKPIGMDSVAGGGRLVPVLLGAGLVIAALEAATFATGNGEFFTWLLSMLSR